MTEKQDCELCKTPTPTDQLVTIGGSTVCAKCKPDVVMNMKSGVSNRSRITPERAEEIRKKISRLNLLSFVFAVPGLLLQVGGGALIAGTQNAPSAAGMIVLLRLIGAPLVIAGLCFYASMKGRSWALGLLGLLSCLGLLILALFSKSCHNCRTTASYRAKECQTCGAPM
jgi:hypothetical protein